MEEGGAGEGRSKKRKRRGGGRVSVFRRERSGTREEEDLLRVSQNGRVVYNMERCGGCSTAKTRGWASWVNLADTEERFTIRNGTGLPKVWWLRD